mgnify:CR=1 FL=1
MSTQVVAERSIEVDCVDRIVAEVRSRYPDAVCLMRSETYGDEDLGIDIYVPEERVSEVSRFAHEAAFNATLGTHLLILPTVAPTHCCPVRL